MADAQPETRSAPVGRAPWWLVAVLAAVAAGAGFGAGALLWAGGPGAPVGAPHVDVQKKEPGLPTLTPEEYDRCVREVHVDFNGPDPDEPMRAAARRLAKDPRVESAKPVTRQQNYAKFLEVFADQPELIEQTQPAALPASVLVTVRVGHRAAEVEDSFATAFPTAEVRTQDICS